MVNNNERQGSRILAAKLTAPLNSIGNKSIADSFLRGGYGQEGYGVGHGSAIDGSHALSGNQGYYTKDSNGNETGKQAFLETVKAMAEFFKRRAVILGKPIKYIIKPGIGGQHTPFQGIADIFGLEKDVKICGEYELGKDYEAFMVKALKELKADWDQVAVIPSSKSGSTDETMMVFVDIFYAMLKHQAIKIGIDGKKFANIALNTLHEVNFIDGKERTGKDLFKVDMDRFGTDNLITLIAKNAKGLGISAQQVKDIFGKVLGNMFFETTDRVGESRLSAFIRNSGLDKELGEDGPGFGAMFDNVGGRWTADLHMMTFLAHYGLDAERYWEIRKKGITKVREGRHAGNALGNKILDEGITDIGLVAPDEFFWFGKSVEQNFNESIWQEGFANLIAIKESQWDGQKKHYKGKKKLVIRMSDLKMPDVGTGHCPVPTKQEKADELAGLFTLFYGITNTVGNRLIARALKCAGYSAGDVDLNDLDNPATKIVQQNLFLRQPYVELGKGLLEDRLKKLQEEEIKNPGAIDREYKKIKKEAFDTDPNILAKAIKNIVGEGFKPSPTKVNLKPPTAKINRKLVPFIYLEGDRFYRLRDELISKGVEWVMQGTGDQHISFQQVLSQPQKYLVFIISFISEGPLPARPAIGFAKGYLHNISPGMVRDLFAEASYNAFASRKGHGFFIRLIDNEKNINIIKEGIKSAVKKF